MSSLEQFLPAVRHLEQTGTARCAQCEIALRDPSSHQILLKPAGNEGKEPEDFILYDAADKNPLLRVYRLVFQAFPEALCMIRLPFSRAASLAARGLSLHPAAPPCSAYFHADIPCLSRLSAQNLAGLPDQAFLHRKSGPYVWDTSPLDAAERAVLLEITAWQTICAEKLRYR